MGNDKAYNPHTGTYSRGACRYGPNGAAFAREAYNPYTDTYAARVGVKTPYGSSGRFYANRDGNEVWGGHESGARGTVGWAQSDQGGKVVAGEGWRGNQGVVAKDKEGNVYVGKDGNVYRKDADGGWSSNSGSGWESVNKPQPATSRTTTTSSRTQPQTSRTQPGTTTQTRQPSTTSWSGMPRESVESLNSQAQSRSWGNQQSRRASLQSSGRGRSGSERSR